MSGVYRQPYFQQVQRRFVLSKAVSVAAALAGQSDGVAIATAAVFTPLNAPTIAAAATVTATTFSQIASPVTDLFVMSWTDQTGSNTNLAAAIDEAGPNDSDYIQSSTSAGIGDEAKIRLAPMADPVSSSGHTLRYRYGKDVAAGDNVDLIVTLYDSDATTVIHTVTHSNVSNTLTDGAFTLSSGETDAITGYSSGLVLGLKRG